MTEKCLVNSENTQGDPKKTLSSFSRANKALLHCFPFSVLKLKVITSHIFRGLRNFYWIPALKNTDFSISPTKKIEPRQTMKMAQKCSKKCELAQILMEV